MSSLVCQTFSLFVLLISASTAKLVTYKVHSGNAISVNDCINSALRKLGQETCVEFLRGAASDAISFVDSGHCLWREHNRTLHLGTNCISEENCARLIAQAVTNERPQYGASRHLNLKYNCTGKCTTVCLNGGKTTADCKCTCNYGFAGPQCEQLKLREQFTDKNCGIIDADENGEGEISLSTYPKPSPKATFCQWLIKPKHSWETVEFEFIEFDGNYENRQPETSCADTLSVYGARGIKNPIPCGPEFHSLKNRRFRSEADWLMVQFTTNAWLEPKYQGFQLKWRVISPKSSKDIRSFDPFASASNSFQTAAFSSVIVVFFSLIVFL